MPAPLAKLQKEVEQIQDFSKLSDSKLSELVAVYRLIDSEWRKRNAIIQSHLANKPKPNMTKIQVSSEGYKPIRITPMVVVSLIIIKKYTCSSVVTPTRNRKKCLRDFCEY